MLFQKKGKEKCFAKIKKKNTKTISFLPCIVVARLQFKFSEKKLLFVVVFVVFLQFYDIKLEKIKEELIC